MTFRNKYSLAALVLMASVSGPALAQDERYQWLETPTDQKALTWAADRTKAAELAIRQLPERKVVMEELKTVLAAGDPPPQFYPLGDKMLRFQRSVTSPHGILSVAKRDRDGALGAWRTVLDVDAMRKADGKAYEFRTSRFSDACLAPDYNRCLISLSPDGADDAAIREFDLEAGKFVEDGFQIPASRSMASWFGKDQLLIMHSADGGPNLASGWPSKVRTWNRGAPLAAAKPVFEAEPGDAILSITTTQDRVDGAPIGVIRRFIDYSTIETLIVRPDGEVEKTNLPTQLKMMLDGASGGRVLGLLSAPAEVDGKTYAAESILAYDASRSIAPGDRLQLVAAPVAGEFMTDVFSGISISKSTIRMAIDRRGMKRIDTAAFRDGAWHVTKGSAEPVGVAVSFGAADPESDAVIQIRSGFLLPTRVDVSGPVAATPNRRLFDEKPVIDASKYLVELKSAASKDGTEIDYFLLRPKAGLKPGATPTLMTGYGAFGISVQPGYFDAWVGGRSLIPWLARGGALAIPLIRGGGDRGAAWHESAIRENRQLSYDDFAAVTEKLISDGFTSPAHLGVFGQSNGGLLAGTMGTQRPDLYGAIVSDVPLTDLIRMPLMGMGAAWTNEYGDPNDPKMAEIINRYSPFQNVRNGVRYPDFLVTVATSDNRVGPGHARKFAAKLLDVGATTYFLEDQEGGHGVSDPLSRPDLMADRMTFLIDTLM